MTADGARPAPKSTRALLAERAAAACMPLSVMFQVTDRCHCDCVHCYEVRDVADELSFAEIDRILGELADEGTMFLGLTGGEVFVRRDADDIVRAARRRQMAVKILTTGHFIDERRADFLASLGAVKVDLSLYAANPDAHDRITRLPGSWHRAVTAVRLLRARGIVVFLKAMAMAGNTDGLGEVAKLARELDCTVIFDATVTCREDGGAGPLPQRLDDEALRRFYACEETGVWQQVSRRAEHGRAGRPAPLDMNACTAGRSRAGIGPSGLVFACHPLNLPCGDLKRQSFREVWRTSEVLARIRGLTWERIDECNHCELRAYCFRCHATALQEDGKLDGPARESCRHAVVVRDLLRERKLIPEDDTALPPTMSRGPRRLPGLRVLDQREGLGHG